MNFVWLDPVVALVTVRLDEASSICDPGGNGVCDVLLLAVAGGAQGMRESHGRIAGLREASNDAPP